MKDLKDVNILIRITGSRHVESQKRMASADMDNFSCSVIDLDSSLT